MIKTNVPKTEEIKKRFSDRIIVLKNHNLTIIVTAVSIAIIIVLSFLYYYYGVRLAPASKSYGEIVSVQPPPKKQELPPVPVEKKPETPEVPNLPEGQYTKITSYTPSGKTIENIKEGKCMSYSIAQPFREDTWRCVVDNRSYDPCFAVDKDRMLCQNNPLRESDMFMVRLSDPPLPKVKKDNWAWFLTFDDGTYCAPYTGRRPQVEGEEVYYGCKMPAGNQTMVILGELKGGIKWIAKTAILFPQNLQKNQWRIVSTKEMEVKEVWQ
ncbi:MAG: hypothetical protein HYT36_02100 [Candidatus Staskawiczbacteria bacterium]|nr:hypothetical protein [Candidatus Staskawiczbacteria bacterium]